MRTRRAGFTLVELLVAVGITAVLAAVLLGLVGRTVTLWERSASALAVGNEAELVLGYLQADLEAVYRDPSGTATGAWAGMAVDEEAGEWRLLVAAGATANATEDPNTLREVTYRHDRVTGRLERRESTAGAVLAADYAWQTWPEDSAGEFLLAERVEVWELTWWSGDREEIIEPGPGAWPALARWEMVLLSPDGVARREAVRLGRSNESWEQIRVETGRRFVQWMTVGGVR